MLALPGFAAGPEPETSTKLPNLVVILADDLGYGDLGCYGSKVHCTPQLDTLAREGVRMTDFYVTSPVCTPARYAMLTGKHPARWGLFGVLWPPSTEGMAPEEVTLAEWLRGQGYVTGLSGKWHLGHADPSMLPLAQGFDEWYGMPYPNDMDPEHPQTQHVQGHWPPMPMVRNIAIIESGVNVDLLTQQYTADAVRFIAQHHDRPFFLLLSHAMPHTHLGASADFKGKSANGLYGDGVEELDWSVGEVMRTLRAFGLEERTMVLFTSDNGAVTPSREDHPDPKWRSTGSNAPLRGGKGTLFEGGVRVPTLIRWPGRIPAQTVIDSPAVITDLSHTFTELAGLPSMPTAVDGLSLAPLLQGRAMPKLQERPLYFGTGDARAVRVGDWKYIATTQPPWKEDATPDPRLYNLSIDPGETDNLLKHYPDVAGQLAALLDAFNTECRE